MESQFSFTRVYVGRGLRGVGKISILRNTSLHWARSCRLLVESQFSFTRVYVGRGLQGVDNSVLTYTCISP